MRKELCRNFQRGSCQYGARCKFVHATTTQQQQHQKNPNPNSNPFGFGVQTNQNNSNRNNQVKVFENKWNRFSPIQSGSIGASPNQTQAADHRCIDPDSCKRIIQDDFKNERPLWNLTCYAHWKYSPCDIVGDISCEELRSAAYDDAKRGLTLPSIVEKERNLLNSKLVEFENLVRNPYKGPANSALPNQSAVTGHSLPQTAPGFGQLGALPNTGFAAKPSASSSSAFALQNSFSSFNQTSNAFGINSSPSVSAGSSAAQFHAPKFGAAFPSNTTRFGNSGINCSQSNQFPASEFSMPNSQAPNNQTSISFSEFLASSNAGGKEMTNVQPSSINSQGDVAATDNGIWLKEKWSPGEIPEHAPPEAYV